MKKGEGKRRSVGRHRGALRWWPYAHQRKGAKEGGGTLCLESRDAPYWGTEGGPRNRTVMCEGTDASPATAKRCDASLGDGDGARVGEASPDRSRRESMVGKAACSKGRVRARAVGRFVPTRSCSAPLSRRPSSSWWRGTLPPERVAAPFRALGTPRTVPSGYGRRQRPVPGTPDDGIRRLILLRRRGTRVHRRGRHARQAHQSRATSTLRTYTKFSAATTYRSRSIPTRTSYPKRRTDESTP